jgi:gluconolactonase
MILRQTAAIALIILLIQSCSQQPIENSGWKIVGDVFSFPEGPAWDLKGNLYVSNCKGDWIAKISDGQIDTLLTESDSTFSKTNGLFVSKEGDIYACDFGIGAILKISPSGEVQIFISGYKGKAFNRPNDLIVLENGDIYFTDPKSYGKDKTDGRVFFYNAAIDSLFLIADSLAFPNGIGISPADKKLYVCESAKSHIIRFDIDKNGLLKNKEKFIELPGGDPDGIEFDIKGNLYTAHFGMGTIFVISPNDEIIQSIKTPGKKPSNLEFGGQDLKTLYLTEDETNSVFKIKVRIPGSR